MIRNGRAEAVAGMDEAPRVLQPGTGTRPVVRLVCDDDGRWIVTKDYRGGSLMRLVLGMILIPREKNAYLRLQGVPGVPELIGADRCSISIAYVDSIASHAAGPDLLTPWFYARLLELIGEMHGRGVAHGDLKRRDNVRVTPAGEPVIIDLGSAQLSGSSIKAAVTMPYLMDADIRAVYKIKRTRTPHLLTTEEARFLNATPWAVRAVQWALGRVRRRVRMLAEREPASRERSPSRDA